MRVLTIGPGGAFSVSGLPPGEYLAAAFPQGTRIVNALLESSRFDGDIIQPDDWRIARAESAHDEAVKP